MTTLLFGLVAVVAAVAKITDNKVSVLYAD